MDTFVGLDVSLKESKRAPVLNQDGTCVFEGKVASEPKAIARRPRASFFIYINPLKRLTQSLKPLSNVAM